MLGLFQAECIRLADTGYPEGKAECCHFSFTLHPPETLSQPLPSIQCTCKIYCIQLLGLPLPSTTDWVAQTIDIDFFTLLKVGGLRQRCQQGGFLWRFLSLACSWPSCPCVFSGLPPTNQNLPPYPSVSRFPLVTRTPIILD